MLSLASTSNGPLRRNATSHFRRALLSSSSSSSSDPPNNNNKKPSSFRPRRPTPKALTNPPPRTHRHQTQNKPQTPIDPIEYEHAMKFLHRAQKNHGSIHVSDLGYDHDTMLRAADYMTSPDGSMEDLVGARRALMDAWTPEQAELYKKVMEETVKEESDKGFQGWSWVEQAEAKQEPIPGLIKTPDEENDDDDEEEDSGDEQDFMGPVELDENGNEIYNDPYKKAFGDWGETIVAVDRVQKVERGGTILRYRALVIGGNLNGCAGFGVAKGYTPNDATVKAARKSRRNIFFVDRYLGSGLTYNVAGKHNSCRVLLRSVPPNKGLVGHPLILEILKYFGISDCTAKSHGNRNVHNVVRATFKAILTHESLEDVALKRGKRLLNMERAKRLNIDH